MYSIIKEMSRRYLKALAPPTLVDIRSQFNLPFLLLNSIDPTFEVNLVC